MAELGFKPDVSVFVASMGVALPRSSEITIQERWRPLKPTIGGGGFQLVWPRRGGGGTEEQPDATAISGQMKPAPFSA